MSTTKQDDVIRMAREAGIEFQSHTGLTGRVRVTTCGSQPIDKIERLIAAAVAAEREACAKWYAEEGYLLDEDDVPSAIRSRGNT